LISYLTKNLHSIFSSKTATPEDKTDTHIEVLPPSV